MAQITKRNITGKRIIDPAAIKTQSYNEPAGAQKVAEVGRHLLALTRDGVTFTTDASGTAIALPAQGKSIAVYNNAATVGSITLGETAAQASLAVGVTDATGHVGVPCAANSWTYIACATSSFVISSAATLIVFLVDDHTYLETTNI